MTPTIRQSLKALHNIQEEDVYTILEIPGFLFMTLHRDSGISEVARYYETIMGEIITSQHLFHPRKISSGSRDEIIIKLLGTTQGLDSSAIARLMAINSTYVDGLKNDSRIVPVEMIVTTFDPSFGTLSSYPIPSKESN